MEQFFRDWSSYIIGILTLIGSIILSITIYKRQRKIKKLLYELVLNYNMFYIREDIKEKISITYDGKKADHIRLILVKFINQGNIPIVKTDYESEIQIVFADSVNIVDAEISEKKPSNIDIAIKKNQNSIFLTPSLLNPGDYYTVRIILDSKKSDFQVLSRIAGIDKIDEVIKKEPTSFMNNMTGLMALTILPLIFIAVYSFFTGIFRVKDQSTLMQILLPISTTLIIMSIPISWLLQKNNSKRY